MSVGGPSPLSTLLVQRLDAVLGTTLAQQANLISGARPDAVTQPGEGQRAEGRADATQKNVNETTGRQQQASGRAGVDGARTEAGQAAIRQAIDVSATPSAPTRLGQAARTILALLTLYPDTAPTPRGRQPLLNLPPLPLSGTQIQAPNGQPQSVAPSVGGGTVPGSAATPPPAPGQTAISGGAEATSGRPSAASPLTGDSLMRPTAGLEALVRQGTAGSVLARALAQAVQTSGMFYESHLQALTFGRYPASALRLEPQAQLGQAVTSTAGESQGQQAQGQQAQAPVTGPAAPPPALAAGLAGLLGMAIRGQSESDTSSRQPPPLPGIAAAPGREAQAQLLIRQQLEVLANQTFVWRGEAWPDAPLDWTIQRREGAPPEADVTDADEHWATTLRLSLPQLGDVSVRLTLVGESLAVQLVAPSSAERLSQSLPQLRERLSDQSLVLTHIAVATEENTS